MGQRCVNRPNRSAIRFFTAKKAGQAACIAIAHGATRQQIDLEIDKCSQPGERRKGSEAAEALAVAESAIEANTAEIDADADALNRFVQFFSFFAPVIRVGLRILPGVLKAAPVTLVALRQFAIARLQQIAVRKAANDSAIQIIRRAAANEREFLRRANR